MKWHIAIHLLFGIGLILNAVVMLFRSDFRVNPIALFIAGLFILSNVIRIKL